MIKFGIGYLLGVATVVAALRRLVFDFDIIERPKQAAGPIEIRVIAAENLTAEDVRYAIRRQAGVKV